MENKTKINPATAEGQKNQTACQDHLNNNPAGTSMGGGQSDQHDKLNYGSEGCDTCKQDFDKNIDSMVGQVENHGQKEHKQQEHEVNEAFGKKGIDNDKPFDSREERSKQSGIHNETDKTGVYGQQGQSDWNKGGQQSQYGKDGKCCQTDQQGQSDWNKTGQHGQQNQYGHESKGGHTDQQGHGDWNKSGSTYGQGTQTGTQNNIGKSEYGTGYKKENDKEIK